MVSKGKIGEVQRRHALNKKEWSAKAKRHALALNKKKPHTQKIDSKIKEENKQYQALLSLNKHLPALRLV